MRHDYLGMWIDFSIPVEVQISKEEYLRGVLDDSPKDITETPETPAASNLFNARDNNERKLLDETEAQAFHHIVAQLIFTSIRFSKDKQTAIDFLISRVSKPDRDNWKKPRRLLG